MTEHIIDSRAGGQEGKPATAPGPRPKKRRPKDIGTAAETAVVRYLAANGWPHAERRALRGELDAGDITGTPGLCWEVKARTRPPSDNQVNAWLIETELERVNAGAEVGILVVRRPRANVAAWWAVLPAFDVAALANLTRQRDPGGRGLAGTEWPVRMLLADAVGLLRAAGFGNPPEEVIR